MSLHSNCNNFSSSDAIAVTPQMGQILKEVAFIIYYILTQFLNDKYLHLYKKAIWHFAIWCFGPFYHKRVEVLQNYKINQFFSC